MKDLIQIYYADNSFYDIPKPIPNAILSEFIGKGENLFEVKIRPQLLSTNHKTFINEEQMK